jgi:hypothetical protein
MVEAHHVQRRSFRRNQQVQGESEKSPVMTSGFMCCLFGFLKKEVPRIIGWRREAAPEDCLGSFRVPQGRRPNTQTWVCVPTYTFPFTAVGTENFTPRGMPSRLTFWLLL